MQNKHETQSIPSPHTKPRCPWADGSPLEREYHDFEWGVPVHDDRTLFEFLILEGAQAGLSWATILKKRENYRTAFDNFDPRRVATYNEQAIEQLITNSGIIRNRLKITAAVKNANAFLEVQKEFGSFDSYLWAFVDGRTIRNAWEILDEIPSKTAESVALSRDLKKRGFGFAGPVICYSFMQAVGMVNDHVVECFRRRELNL